MNETLINRLIRHEGLRLKPYKDSIGKLTIGVGRNLEDFGITKDEALYMLRNNVALCMAECRSHIPFFDKLDKTRQDVLLEIDFNIGIGGLMKFHNMLAALEKGDYITAAKEIINSKAAAQTGNRYKELADLMVKGGEA